ncbi:MAG: hypothetical protein KKB59_02110, partial [Spirochaetes bacterium]|nr:hypothetical protein [Spirochaetota bacterium]
MTARIPLLLATSLCAGSAALALVAACAHRSGRRELARLRTLFLGLLCLAASNHALLSLGMGSLALPGGAGAFGISRAMYALMRLNQALTLASSLAGARLAEALLDAPWRRAGAIAAAVLAAGALALSLARPSIAYDAAARTVYFSRSTDAAQLASLALIAYAYAILIAFRARIPEARARRLAIASLALSALFVPGLATDILSSGGKEPLGSVAPILGFSAAFPLYLIAASAVAIGLSFGYLAGPGRPSEVAAAVEAAHGAAELARGSGLSPREE